MIDNIPGKQYWKNRLKVAGDRKNRSIIDTSALRVFKKQLQEQLLLGAGEVQIRRVQKAIVMVNQVLKSETQIPENFYSHYR
ncbi:MAG TPA: hypothetical protein VGC95_03380, partial [Chitinophagaceae bacterium]